jgi:hypothetical protein
MTARTQRRSLATAQWIALAAGVLGLLAFGLLSPLGRGQPLLAYLIGYVFWSNIAIGSLGLLMLQHVMRSDWGRSLRPMLEAAAGTFPLLALLFLPIALGLRHIYDWSAPASSVLSGDHVAAYFNRPWFVVRALAYFLLWSALGARLQRAPLDAAAPGARRTRVLSAWGLVLLILSSTFAAIDWVRSLSPHWHSTTFGLYFIAGQGLSAFAFAAVFAIWLATREPWFDVRLAPKPLHDVSKLTFTFVILWAYIAFTQFLIIWAGNIPDEAVWYVTRTRDGWEGIAVSLIVLHFALPFLLLLPRYTNDRRPIVASIAAFVLVMRFVDVYWLIAPARDAQLWPPRWLALFALLGIGGLWLSALLWRLQPRVPDMPRELATAQESRA